MEPRSAQHASYTQLTPEQLRRKEQILALKQDIKILADSQSKLKYYRKQDHNLFAGRGVSVLRRPMDPLRAQLEVELNRSKLHHMYLVYGLLRNKQWAIARKDDISDYGYNKAILDNLISKYGTGSIVYPGQS